MTLQGYAVVDAEARASVRLRFFVICFGDQFIDLLQRALVRSLMQPLNRAAIPPDAVFSVYTYEATQDRIREILAPFGCQVEMHMLPEGEHYDVQNQAFIDEVQRCVHADAALIIANPDLFWGDGSLPNMLEIAGQQDIALAVPHPRVDRDKFLNAADYPDTADSDVNVLRPGPIPISNSKLVRLAMGTLHRSWAEADQSRPEVNSFLTGIGITHARSLHYVHHLLPTVFYARLAKRDYSFFTNRPTGQGLWDHHWPLVLAEEQRQRTVACSDAIFIVELTGSDETDTHHTDLRSINPKSPSDYFRDGSHIKLNRNVVGVWREG